LVTGTAAEGSSAWHAAVVIALYDELSSDYSRRAAETAE
jgi:hypothetical protein